MSEPEVRRDRAKRRFTVDSLFTDTRLQAVGVDDLVDAKLIALGRIVPDPDQPRQTIDEERLEELAESIRQQGVLQPIVVRYDQERDCYVIVHGERRWRAAQRAGTPSLPALVRDVPADRRLIHQLMENVIRDDLNAVDRAAALRQLKSMLGDAPWDQVAAAVGIKRSRLFQLLGTGKLSSQARADIQQGRLSEKQSRALQGLPAVKQDALRELLVQERLPEQVAMRLARAYRDFPTTSDDAEAARRALSELRTLLLPEQSAGIRHQTSTLLRALGRAAEGSNSDRRRLGQLAKLVGSPNFDEAKLTRELGDLVRMLARLPLEPVSRPDTVTEQLTELRDALDAILKP